MKLNPESLKKAGWRPVDYNVTRPANGSKPIRCGYVYIKENIQLTHDEIIDWVIVKVLEPGTSSYTALKGEFKTLEEFDAALSQALACNPK